ncbi:TonB-dependent receptor [Sphingobium phenoxybenzoativorans]|uniref:TonB-dependent receptor n=1 Tax=Sphingobium phenoxybenzoativorans TaxID=1592790 RepID=UPI000A7F3F0F|nr:TonB-dependent receptor [Sphingobium phenoxybenzoativorans]
MRKQNIKFGSLGLGIGASLFGSAALAQTTGVNETPPVASSTTSGGIDDIVVTAERREQSVQKVPLTIQVVSGTELAKSGVTSAIDLNKITTGVEIGKGGSNNQIFIRGVGAFAFSPLSSPGVAFNVDGIYVGRPNGVDGNFYDIARVEVLKGPQGTLYGRNANGGSINVITNEATLGRRTLDLNIEGGNYSLLRANGAINLPVGDNAAIRAAFNLVHRNGYLSDGANDDIQQSARLRFKWMPDPDVTIQLNADYSHLGGKGGDYVYLPRRPGASPYEAQTAPAANAYMHGFAPLGPFVADLQPDTAQNTVLYNFSAQVDWRIGDFATLTVLPAYRRVEARYVTHFASRFQGDEDTRQTSVEARLGNSTADFTWVVGAYYYNEKAPNSINDVFVSDVLQNFHIVYSPKTEAYATFGQATVGIVDGLRLIAGGRYTYEMRRLQGSLTSLLTTPPTVLEEFGGAKNFRGFTYKVGAEFDLSPSNMVFLTYSTGFKSGGLAQTVAPLAVFKPEKLASLELGFRNRFLNNRLQLNFGAYHWKYKALQDQRVGIDPLGVANFLTFNSGAATIYGATVDVLAKLTPSDTLSFAGEYAHSRYDSFFIQTPAPFFQAGSLGCRQAGPFAPGASLPYRQSTGSTTNDGPFPVFVNNCAGLQVARVPEWTGTISYGHTFDLPSGASLLIDASAKYSSARWINTEFIPVERDGKYAVLDANVTYTAADGKYSIGIFGRNLTKTVYYTGGVQAVFVPGLFAANIAPPRTYGVRADFKFGQ